MGLFHIPEFQQYIDHPAMIVLIQFVASLVIQGGWVEMYQRIGKIGYILNPLIMFVQGNVMKAILGLLSEAIEFKPYIIFTHILATVIVNNFNLNKPILNKIFGIFMIFFDFGGMLYFLDRGFAWHGYIGAYISVMMSFVIAPFFYTFFVVFIFRRSFIGIYVKWSTLGRRTILLTVQLCVFLYLINIHSMYTYYVILGSGVLLYIDDHYLHILDKFYTKIGL